MLNNYLCSIIVPIYNVEKYIKQCIESAINQTYRNIEIILVDDGSTDNSKLICDEYRKKDHRIKVIHKENGGLSSAREVGVNYATGDYITFLDGDDWLDANAIETCIELVEKDFQIDCILFSYTKEFGDYSVSMHVMDEDNNMIGEEAIDKVHRRLFGLSNEELDHPERMENICTCWGKLYRHDVAKKGKYFDTKEVGSCEDGLFNIYALMGCSNFAYIDKSLYHYRKHNGSLTKRFHSNFINQWNRLYDIMFNIVDEYDLGINYIKAINNRISLSIISIGLNELENKKSNHIEIIRDYINSDRYREAINDMRIENLPIKWRALLYCCKKGWHMPAYLGIKTISIILK